MHLSHTPINTVSKHVLMTCIDVAFKPGACTSMSGDIEVTSSDIFRHRYDIDASMEPFWRLSAFVERADLSHSHLGDRWGLTSSSDVAPVGKEHPVYRSPYAIGTRWIVVGGGSDGGVSPPI